MARRLSKKTGWYVPWFADCDNQNGMLVTAIEEQEYTYWRPSLTFGAKKDYGWSDGNHHVVYVAPTQELWIDEIERYAVEKGKPRPVFDDYAFIIDIFHNMGHDALRGFGESPFQIEISSPETFRNRYPSAGRGHLETLADWVEMIVGAFPDRRPWPPL